MTNIGLVFSGGGARGIAHLGVLQALEETGIRPSVISGVSAGALIGALYASGYTARELLELVKDYSRPSLAKIIQSPLGLFSSSGLMHLLKANIKTDDFAKLQTPLFVTATDMFTNRSVTFSQGPLFDAVIGSAAIPGLFSLVERGEYKLADGGILNNLPAECIKHNCEKIIGVNVNNFKPDTRTELGRMQLLDKSFHLAISAKVAANASLCDLFIEPAVTQFSMFDMGDVDSIFTAGYQAAIQQRQLLLQWLD